MPRDSTTGPARRPASPLAARERALLRREELERVAAVEVLEPDLARGGLERRAVAVGDRHAARVGPSFGHEPALDQLAVLPALAHALATVHELAFTTGRCLARERHEQRAVHVARDVFGRKGPAAREVELHLERAAALHQRED